MRAVHNVSHQADDVSSYETHKLCVYLHGHDIRRLAALHQPQVTAARTDSYTDMHGIQTLTQGAVPSSLWLSYAHFPYLYGRAPHVVGRERLNCLWTHFLRLTFHHMCFHMLPHRYARMLGNHETCRCARHNQESSQEVFPNFLNVQTCTRRQSVVMSRAEYTPAASHCSIDGIFGTSRGA
jgi:hypothetical protein